jgi:hypothetical protein
MVGDTLNDVLCLCKLIAVSNRCQTAVSIPANAQFYVAKV